MPDEPHNELIAQTIDSQQKAFEMMDKLFVAAHADAVFAKPVKAGDYTVIMASEVAAGGGLGSALVHVNQDKTADPHGGGGAGGGGGSSGRPVAAIVIGPNGVEIKPVFDRTKVLIGLLAAAGGLLVTFRQLRRHR